MPIRQGLGVVSVRQGLKHHALGMGDPGLSTEPLDNFDDGVPVIHGSVIGVFLAEGDAGSDGLAALKCLVGVAHRGSHAKRRWRGRVRGVPQKLVEGSIDPVELIGVAGGQGTLLQRKIAPSTGWLIMFAPS